MLGEKILKHIDKVLSNAESNSAFEARVDQFAAERSITLGPDDKNGMIQLARDYVHAVANLLIECDIAATHVGIQRFTAPIIQTAASYFLNTDDYISDKQGLYGLIDDAYLACRFVTRISDLVAAERGFPLIDTSLDSKSPVIRVLIGEPIGSQLDADVDAVIETVLSEIKMETMQALQFQYRWSNWAHNQNIINTEAQIMSIAGGSFY